MFLRRNRRSYQGKTYEYWLLMRTLRTAKGPRQQVVAPLGKSPGLDQDHRRSWEHVTDLLEGRGSQVGRFGQVGRCVPTAPPPFTTPGGLGQPALPTAPQAQPLQLPGAPKIVHNGVPKTTP